MPVLLLLPLLLLLQPPATRPAPSLPVRWTGHTAVTRADLARLDEYLDRPVVTHPDADDSRPTLIGPADELFIPVTAREWLDARAAGYTPRANIDRKLEGAYKRHAYPALWLAQAKPASVSHIADLKPDLLATRWMPPQWSLLYDEEVSAERAIRLGRPPVWTELFPTTRVVDRGPHTIRLEDGEEAGILLNFIAWGDYDGDGREDVLIEVCTYAPRGSFAQQTFVALTRIAPGGRLIELSYQD